MKPIMLSLFAIAFLFSAADPALAQPKPCALVCAPPENLDADNCKCVRPSVLPPRPCALTCVGPDESLDAKQCRCVKRPL